LIDTGYDAFIAIDEKLAEKLQLLITKRTRVFLANGTAMTTPNSQLTIELETNTGILEFDCPVLIMQNLDQPVIGLPFLESVCTNLKTEFTVNFAEKIVKLVKA
jgi:predicted aspartyl protease